MTREEAGQQFLAHYGIKGMRWGRRKAKDESPTEATINQTLTRKGKTKLKAEGGERQPASEDAIAVAAARQKLRKSGTAALSNQELKQLETRLNLEVNVTRLDAETQSGGKKFVKGLVTDTAKGQTKRAAGIQSTKLVDKQLKKVG